MQVFSGAADNSEFLAAGIGNGDDATSLLDRLRRYERRDPAIVRALGGDHFAPRRLRLVPR